ncbi:MAG: ABC transporter ATP-binding protein [Chloroflexi bacterium]|nr:MAG: ABC transporter ATP-binding protein [Chloroflexota bacterium]MBL1195060.1 ABC transporter ATP-binding protein [Chloroflexota bacterium]NOH12348.1 ABC transporter ATP-binding protein [Chloroflexota bacterium]
MIANAHQSEHVSLLSIRDISVQFGGLLALNAVNLDVNAGARYGILGPNGAGKTTLFNAISGFVDPSKGEIKLNSKKLDGLPSHERVLRGLSRTFQITTLFPELSVLENVLMAAQVDAGKHQVFWRAANSHKEVMQRVEAQLVDLNLSRLALSTVSALSYGEQRLLEIAVALASKPSVLLLDEPTAGLSAAEMRSVVDLILKLPQDLTIVLIEHDLDVVFDVSEELSVLHFGNMIAQGPASQIREDPLVREVYLGEA